MNTMKARRTLAKRAGAARPRRASGSLAGRGMPMRITAISWAVLLTGAGLVIAGCSASSNSGGGASAASAPRAGARYNAAGRHAAANLPVAGPAAGTGAGSGQGTSKSAGTTTATGARLLPASQDIIMTASLTVRVHDAGSAAAAASGYVTGAGGYTAGEQAQLSPSARQRQTVSMTLKVPQADYGTALAHLSGLGRATSLQQQSTDVTGEVADVASRVTSAQDAIAQLRTLLKRAASVSGLLQVQQQISGDESSLEALQAQQRALSRETSYATISLLLLGPKPHAVHHHRHHARAGGFVGGLTAGWHGLRDAVSAVLTALGAILPFAAAVAVIGGVIFAVWRRIARRRAAPGPAPASES
jgi:Domain of unknown function (DUF4349)